MIEAGVGDVYGADQSSVDTASSRQTKPRRLRYGRIPSLPRLPTFHVSAWIKLIRFYRALVDCGFHLEKSGPMCGMAD